MANAFYSDEIFREMMYEQNMDGIDMDEYEQQMKQEGNNHVDIYHFIVEIDTNHDSVGTLITFKDQEDYYDTIHKKWDLDNKESSLINIFKNINSDYYTNIYGEEVFFFEIRANTKEVFDELYDIFYQVSSEINFDNHICFTFGEIA